MRKWISKSQNEVAMVNENLNSLKEVCYTKDIDILSLSKELEPHRPQNKDSLCNNKVNFIDLLDSIEVTKLNDVRKTKKGKKRKLTADYILKKFSDACDRIGGERLWYDFLNDYSNTIRLITGEVFTKKIDSLFAIDKHRDKVDILFDVYNENIK